MPRLLVAALLYILLAAPIRVHAQDDVSKTHLTSRGRFMLSGAFSGIWSNDAPALYGSYNTWTVRATPSLVYFLREHLGLGASISGGTSRGDFYPAGNYKSNEFGVACELVWSLPIGKRWSVMVRPSIGYTHAWSTTVGSFIAGRPPIEVERRRDYLRLTGSLPFVYALSEAIGLGLGPDVLFDYMLGQDVEHENVDELVESPGRTRAQVGASVALYVSF